MARSPAQRAADFTDLDLFAGGFPHHVFAPLREEAPVAWNEARFARFELAEPVERSRTNEHAGVKHMPVRLVPT